MTSPSILATTGVEAQKAGHRPMATVGTTTLRGFRGTLAGTPPQDIKTTVRHKDSYGPVHEAQTQIPDARPFGDKVARRRASVEQRDWAKDRPVTTSNTTPGGQPA